MTRNEIETPVSRCRGCDRPYSVPGYAEIGCTEWYVATGETAQQAWCAETGRYVRWSD